MGSCQRTRQLGASRRRFHDRSARVHRPALLGSFDEAHSNRRELRWWLLGRVDARILLVRYTHRPNGVIRLIGAGYWREGRDYYENFWKNEGR